MVASFCTNGLSMTELTSEATAGEMYCEVKTPTTAFSKALLGGAPAAIDMPDWTTTVPMALAAAVLVTTPELTKELPIEVERPPVRTASPAARAMFGAACVSWPRNPPVSFDMPANLPLVS